MTRFSNFFGPKPKWKHSDVNVRIDAAKNITDQDLLYRIATTDKNIRVKMTAIDGIDDEDFLFKIAKDGKGLDSLQAFVKIKDRGRQDRLMEDSRMKAKIAAFLVATKPELLARYAVMKKDPRALLLALQMAGK